MAIADNTHPELAAGFQKQGIRILCVPEQDRLPKGLARHADLFAHHLGGNEVLFPSKFASFDGGVLISHRCEKTIGEVYPDDCLLNSARIGRFVVGNPDCIDSYLKAWYEKQGVQLIPVKQGYTKCSICIVNETALITDDTGIAAACQKHGFDTLLVSKGDVRLPGYSYGLIGGCSALIAPDKLLFFGDIKRHRDSEQILRFLAKHSVEPIALYAGALLDIGGMVPLLEI